MTNVRLQAALQQVCNLLESPSRSNVADRQLLELYVRQQDQTAFAILLHRYGPMVWHVTRRVLSSWHDTEDVFQATFLLLARKAASIHKQESVASWLHGVAYRLAIQLRRQGTRRQERERQARTVSVQEPGFESAWRELQTVLDEELAALPDKYRTPLVLCYLEGKTHDEAAAALGWPVGTVRGRLARARDALRKRLGKRGLALTATAFATLLAGTTISAAVPVALTNTTLLAAAQAAAGNTTSCLVSAQAATLVEGAMQSMMVAKVKLGLALLLVAGLTLAGVGAMLPGGGPGRPLQDTAVFAADVKDKPADAPKPGLDRLGDPLPPTVLARLGTARMTTSLGDRLQPVFSPDGKVIALAGNDGSVSLWDTENGKLLKRHEARSVQPNRFTGLFDFAITPDNKALAALDLTGKALILRDLTTGKELRKVEIEVEKMVATFLLSPDGKILATIEQATTGPQADTVKLWDTESGKSLGSLKGHTAAVMCLAFSPDSKTIFTGSQDQALRRWDATNAKEQTAYEGHRDTVRAIAVAPNGKTAATVSTDGTLRLWDVESGKEIKKTDATFARVEAQRLFNISFAFAGEGKKLVLASALGTQVWDVATGKQERVSAPTGGGAIPNVVSPNGRLLAVAEYNQRLKLFDSVTGKESIEFEGHKGAVQIVAFSPNGKLLATAGQDQAIRIWEVPSGKTLGVLRGHLGTISLLSFSPDGKYLLSASNEQNDRVVSLWDVSSGKEIRGFRDQAHVVTGIGFGEEAKTVLTITRDNIGHVYETATGKKVRDIKGLGNAACVLAKGNTILSLQGTPNQQAVGQMGSILVHDIATGELQRTLKTTQSMTPPGGTANPYGQQMDIFSFTPDGKLLATNSSFAQNLQLWDVESGKRLRQLVPARTPEELVRIGSSPNLFSRSAPAFSPDGRFVAALGKDNKLVIFEIATGMQRRVLHTDQPTLSSLAFSPDGRVLASASMDSTVLLWDLTAPMPGDMLADKPLNDKDLDGLWTDLASEEGAKVERAVQRLVAAPKQAVPFLKKNVKPTATKDGAEIDKLIADLDSDMFETRKAAEAELTKLGLQAKAAMQRALKDKPPLDVSKRLEELLSKLEDNPLPPDQARLLRGVEVLERIGDKDARETLETLARGAKDHMLTDEAKAALQRVK